MSAPPPSPRQYRALAKAADGHRRAGYKAAAARDQVTAISQYREAIELVRRIAAITPADHDLLRQLAGSYHHEGHFAAVMGYAVAVRYEYEAELILLERISRDQPDDEGLLRSQAEAHHELARRAQFDGDQERVKREQQAEVAILRQLALADPETRDLLQEATAETGAGAAASAAADAVPADAGRAGPVPADPVPADPVPSDPEPPDAEERIQSLNSLVERARAADDGVTVRAGLRALVLLRKQIVAARPGDTGALNDLATAHRELGWRWQMDGDYEAGKREHREEVAILRQLALADPAIGDLLREAMGGGAGAEPAAPAPAPAPDSRPPPADAGARIQNLEDLADRARAANDKETEEASYQALVSLREQLAAARPGEVQPLLDLAAAHHRLSSLYAATAQDGEACLSAVKEVAVLTSLAAAAAADEDRQTALADAYVWLAHHASVCGQLDRARAAAQAEVIVRGWLAAAQPVTWRHEALTAARSRLNALRYREDPDGPGTSRLLR